jgi:hypothetical protein
MRRLVKLPDYLDGAIIDSENQCPFYRPGSTLDECSLRRVLGQLSRCHIEAACPLQAVPERERLVA